MPIPAINEYLDRLEERMMETRLMMADATTIPHLKPKVRKATLNRWMKALNMHTPVKAKHASEARLKMMGIGVRHV